MRTRPNTASLPFRALDSGQHILSRSQLSILAPITNPEKVICVGMNYVDHCLEQNVPVPKEPIIFSKFPNAIVGPYDSIVLPTESQVSVVILRGEAVVNVLLPDR